MHMPSKIEKKQKAAKLRKPPRDFSYTQNRELSWLRFDNRVLDEAFDETVPLFERLKFVSIFESNLDEFLMVRVGGLSDLAELKKQPVDNKSNMTASEQVDAVMAELPGLLTRWESIFKSIEGKLDTLGVHRAGIDSLTPEERTFVTRYFQAYVSPVISPLVIDPRHPFPNLRNGALFWPVAWTASPTRRACWAYRDSRLDEPRGRDPLAHRHLLLHLARGRHPRLPGQLLWLL